MSKEWAKLQGEYRKLIFGVGVGTTKEGKAYRKEVDAEVAEKMLAKAVGGKIALTYKPGGI